HDPQAIRGSHRQTDDYKLHHIIEKVDKKGQLEAGLRKGCLVTNINGQSVIGLHLIQVMKLMIDKHNSFLYINTFLLTTPAFARQKKRLPTLWSSSGETLPPHLSGSC
ncbi:hypothetical protein GBAR_LOCUS28197, partial [Geodia barretti]